MGEILCVIPWEDVPERLREVALDRARPHGGPVRNLLLTRGGRMYPMVRKFRRDDVRRLARARRWRHRRRPRRWWLEADDGRYLREAGYLPVGELAKAMGYSRDQLRLLAREGRCGAQKYRGGWWLHRRSLEVYAGQRVRHGRRGGRG